REGGRASEEALALSGGPPELRAQVLTRVSDFPKFQGDLVRAAEMKEEAIAFFREYDDELDLASALKDLAELVGVQGDTARAHQLAEEAPTEAALWVLRPTRALFSLVASSSQPAGRPHASPRGSASTFRFEECGAG